ncbi:MAG TPA: LppP/LprE family lipoprotein [Acidimicrobiia bacterium]|nr:LppP/LprE family lipoprotein [Acidimicrobiia bacterium]
MWWIGGLGALILVLVVVLVVVLASGGSSPSTVVTTTTTSSPPPPTAPPSSTPTATQIAQQLSQTRDPQTGSGYQVGDMGSVSDGSGGMLTAVSGFDQSVNHPPCLVFFWHDDSFVGTDSTQAHMGCVLVHSAAGVFVVDYEVFAPTDPLCCPSGADDVTYTWNGRSFVPNGAPPPTQ